MNLELRLYCLRDLRNFEGESTPLYGAGPEPLSQKMIFRLIQIQDTMQNVGDIWVPVKQRGNVSNNPQGSNHTYLSVLFRGYSILPFQPKTW